jgi:hypothetical protein
MTPTDILNTARDVLSGEPARAIGYGAAVIVYLVARASGSIEDVPLEDAIVLTAGYVATVAGVIESIRRFVTPVANPNLPDADAGEGQGDTA